MNRRRFIKTGALFVPAILIPRLIRAQPSRMAVLKAAAATQRPGAGVVGCDSVNDSFLQAYWKLGEASGSRADSKGSNNLADSGSTGSATGIIGNGASFAGATSLSIADTSAISAGGTDFSVSVWFKTTTVSGLQIVIGKNAEWLLYLSNNQLIFQNDAASGPQGDFIATPTLSAGTWYHVVLTQVNSTGVKTIIVNNGTPDVTGGTFGVPHTTDAFCIGSDNPAATFANFSGVIDEALFTKRILTSSEITALYNGGSACLPSGL